jgi:hypothetical protein
MAMGKVTDTDNNCRLNPIKHHHVRKWNMKYLSRKKKLTIGK